MSFWNSFYNQLGRDTGRRVGNKIYGNKHAKKVEVTNSSSNGSGRKYNYNYTKVVRTKEDAENDFLQAEHEREMEKYTDSEGISTLRFSSDSKKIIDDIDILLTNANILLGEKDFISSYGSSKKANAYINKISEGLKKLKRNNVPEATINSLEEELDSIKQMFFKIQKRRKNKSTRKKLFLLIPIGLSAAWLFNIWNHGHHKTVYVLGVILFVVFGIIYSLMTIADD